MDDVALMALDAGAQAQAPRQYIDQAGVHYLKLVEYHWLDGSGFKETLGPAFTFEVVESDSYPRGDRRSRVLPLNARGRDAKSTVGTRQAKGRETLDVVRALFASNGGAPPDDNEKVLQLLQNTDKFVTAFAGTVVRCNVAENVKPTDNGVKTYHNCTWFADDRAEAQI